MWGFTFGVHLHERKPLAVELSLVESLVREEPAVSYRWIG